MRVLSWVVLAALGVAGCARRRGAQEQTIKVGIARSTSNAAELMALKHGYFKEAGIKLEWDDIDTTANVIALLAQNQFQIVAGGISAGIFNALEKDLPITILSDRVSTPIGHNLMLRPELKDTVKSLKDLKGRPVASNGAGLGLDLRDRQDAGARRPQAHRRRPQNLAVHPDGHRAQEQGDRRGAAHPAVHLESRGSRGSRSRSPTSTQLVQPQPMTIAVIMANSDWVKANPDLVRRYMTAWLRGARMYCQAYHGASNRQEIIDELVSTKTAPSRELLEKYPVAGAQPERQDQRREHARHQQVVRREQDVGQAVPGGAHHRFQLHRLRHPEARAVRAAEQGQQAAGLPLTRMNARAGEA